MKPSGNLLAWIEPRGTDRFMGAFVGEFAAPGASRHFPGRAPATQLCSSPDEARQWVEEQALAFGVPIKWVSDIRPGS
jgi:hypothetical protein